ncbi:hypothetical protein KQH82_03105 [bacterium]|nr:hypothetical protein [bacterium]
MKSIVIILAATVLLGQAGMAEQKAQLRPYVWFGTTLTSPSADDLGYVSADGDNLDSYLDFKKANYGAGLQLFLSSNSAVRFGGDIGIRKLFSAEFNTGSSDISFVDEDYDTEVEYDIAVLGIVEYALPNSQFFIQGGLGLHFVHWSWESNYSSDYSASYSGASGTGTNMGLMGAAGTSIALTPTLSMPLMLRIDYIARYGGTMPVTVMAGLNFTIQ